MNTLLLDRTDSWPSISKDSAPVDYTNLRSRILKAIPESSKRQNLNLLHASNHLHSIYIIVFTTIYMIFTLYLATSCVELTHCWEGLGAGGKGDNRGWDGWMASPTRWTWVWVDSGSWWWTGRPGMLQFMGSQRVGHDWATELNRTEVL